MPEDRPSPPTESVRPESDPRILQGKFQRDRTGHPERIGPYRILQVLGEGGMGVVYLAERSKPVHQRVALKIIKAGLETKQVLARFETEREALALMNHPNVARVFDAGVEDGGRPYFVMEHVHGIPITDYCDRQRLTTTERLRLFVGVCQAVQHAHQKGIIHRDIKPSNVLVAVHDDRPVAKVIDFGVAKATQNRLTELTVFTEHGQLIGTPGYTSPEQSELTALDIDTRTDIYSLGVLLYELLVGARPFEEVELRRAGLAEMQRIIREVDPPKPSTRLSSLGAHSTTVAQSRRTDLRTLSRQLRGDLDWIVMKCLEKDRTRRYDTASGLAMDIERHLNHEPVLAGPPSVRYRLGKFVRKNWGPVAAALTVGLALSAGLASTMVMSRQADRARAEAVAAAEETARERQTALKERDRARREAEKARQALGFMVDMFQAADPFRADGEAITAREVLDRGADRIQEELRGQPMVQAALMQSMALAYRNLGLLAKAKEIGETALALLKGSGDAGSLAEAESQLAVTLAKMNEFPRAEALLRNSLNTDSDSVEVELAKVLERRRWLASVLSQTGRTSQARSILLETLGALPHRDGEFCKMFTRLQFDLGALHWQANEPDAAVQCYRAGVAAAANHPSVYDFELAQAQHHFANHLLRVADVGDEARLSQAEELLQSTILAYRRILPPDHPSIASALSDLGNVYRGRRQFEEGRLHLEAALDMRKKAFGEVHSDVAGDHVCLGALYRDHGDLALSVENYTKALAIRRQLFEDENVRVAVTRSGLGATLSLAGEHDRAIEELLEAQRVFDLKLQPGHPQSRANLERLVAAYRAAGREEDARQWERRLAGPEATQ